MKPIFLFLSVLYAVLEIAAGQRIRRECPDVVTKGDFNISRYLGDWYEDKRFAALFELGQTCVKANYAVMENGSIQVTNTGITRLFRIPTSATGIATVPDRSQPGKLSVSFSETGNPGPYWIVDTDYDTYSLVYSCQSYFGIFSAELAWVLRRSKSVPLDSSLEDQLNSKLRMYDIDPEKLHNVYDASCSSESSVTSGRLSNSCVTC